MAWGAGSGGWGGLFRRRSPTAWFEAEDDPFAEAGRAEPEANALTALLDQVEATALSVYAEHGLPTRRGHYRKGPRAKRWRWIAERVSPEDRFAMVLARPPEKGWRHGALEDIGALERGGPRLVEAARLLAGVALLRRRLREGAMFEDLAAALALGADWRALSQAVAFSPPPRRLALKPPAGATRDRRRPQGD